MNENYQKDARLTALETAIGQVHEEQRRMETELRREKQVAEASARRWRLTAVLAAVVGMLISPALTHYGSAAAPDTKVKTPPVPKRLATLERAVFGVTPVPVNTPDRITAVQNALTQETTARQALQTTVSGVQTTVSSLQFTLVTVQSSVAALQTTVAAQAAILAPFSIRFFNGTDAGGGYDVYLTGANLHVLNGLGATNGEPDDPTDTVDPITNGLGNLILGYDEHFTNQVQNGSHNLVVGTNHTFSSFGGAVIGLGNSITAPFASVSGGSDNIASGPGAAVLGGSGNIAVGGLGCSVGGFDNLVSGSQAVVMGGFNNIGSGQQSCVSGGYFNTAGATLSSIGGGLGLMSNTDYGWASGGQNPAQPVGGVYPFYAGAFHSP